MEGIDHRLTKDVFRKAVTRLKNKAPEDSGLTSQIFKSLVDDEHSFVLLINVVIEKWDTEKPPDEWDVGLLKILPLTKVSSRFYHLQRFTCIFSCVIFGK